MPGKYDPDVFRGREMMWWKQHFQHFGNKAGREKRAEALVVCFVCQGRSMIIQSGFDGMDGSNLWRTPLLS